MLSTAVRDDAPWAEQAACRDVEDRDAMFPTGPDAQRAAAKQCRRCPVMAECLAFALDNRMDFGVWGGRTENERRAIRRRSAAAHV